MYLASSQKWESSLARIELMSLLKEKA